MRSMMCRWMSTEQRKQGQAFASWWAFVLYERKAQAEREHAAALAHKHLSHTVTAMLAMITKKGGREKLGAWRLWHAATIQAARDQTAAEHAARLAALEAQWKAKAMQRLLKVGQKKRGLFRPSEPAEFGFVLPRVSRRRVFGKRVSREEEIGSPSPRRVSTRRVSHDRLARARHTRRRRPAALIALRPPAAARRHDAQAAHGVGQVDGDCSRRADPRGEGGAPPRPHEEAQADALRRCARAPRPARGLVQAPRVPPVDARRVRAARGRRPRGPQRADGGASPFVVCCRVVFCFRALFHFFTGLFVHVLFHSSVLVHQWV